MRALQPPGELWGKWEGWSWGLNSVTPSGGEPAKTDCRLQVVKPVGQKFAGNFLKREGGQRSIHRTVKTALVGK